MEPSAPTIVAIAAPPIDTTVELRRQHSALLQRDVAGEGTAKPSPGEILGFLESASRLGRSLDDLDARDTAQGIMDFWIARLISQAPQTAEGSRPFSLEAFDESSAMLMASDAQQLRTQAVQAAQRADDMLPAPGPLEKVKKLPMTRALEMLPGFLRPFALRIAAGGPGAVLQRMLMRFIRLKENSLEAYSVPVTPEDSIFREKDAQAVLGQLTEAGVVRKQEAADGGTQSYVLTHDSLITEWNFLREIVMQRKGFRQLARGWVNGGRHNGALVTSSDQLTQALDFPQLDDLEREFLEASRRASERTHQRMFGFASLIVIVLGWFLWQQVNKSGELKEAKEQLERQKEQLQKQNEELSAAKKLLELANTELTQKKEDLEQQLALVRTANSQIMSIKEQLSPRADLSPDFKQQLQYTGDNNAAQWVKGSKGLVEIFVSQEVEGLVKAAVPVAEALKQAGYRIPAGGPLRRRTVSDPTEVRYYYPEDKPLANEVASLLERAGVKPPIQVKDHTADTGQKAPKKFIQISVARRALTPVSQP